VSATAARRAAHAALQAVARGALADRAFAAALAEHQVPTRDRRWTQELVYGTLRLRGRLDALLERVVRGGLERVDAPILEVLRLGAYQLLEMRSVPPHAAVSQAVELAREVGGEGAARFTNGVLRALVRGGAETDFPREPVARLSSWGSHPRWLVERWVERWGADVAERLVEANNTRPELYLRPVGMSAAAAVAALEAAGIAAQPVAFAPDAVRLTGSATPAEALAVVPALVQDPAAGLVVRYAAPPAGALVVDLCAAPGGKAVGLADALATVGGGGAVVAGDSSAERMVRLRENLVRLGGALRVLPVVADGRRPPLRTADVVLVDAPCTGTGTFRRHPDGRWRLRPGDLETLGRLQGGLLEAAAALVRPGGLLVYATCSLEPEENEARVAALLARRPELTLEPAPAEMAPGLVDDAGFLRVEPWRQGVDGAFAARLRRRPDRDNPDAGR